MRSLAVGVLLVVALAGHARATAPTRSSPLAVAADGTVFVVNPDSNSVARLVFGASPSLIEAGVGRYPRTLALAGTAVYTADQGSHTVSRRAQGDLGGLTQVDLGAGCSPYGIAATPAGDHLLVSCQGTSEVVVLDPGLGVEARVRLDWPNARGIAITADGAKAYVTHYLTEEPGTDAHVSVLDLGQRTVMRVFALPADATTCETQNSGQGVLNLLSAIAIVPAGPLAGQVWVGGTQENVVSKGLFKRFPPFSLEPGTGLFPEVTFTPFPQAKPPPRRRRHGKPKPAPLDASASRNKYKASFHDVTRFGIYKLDGVDGHMVGKIDVDEANNATDVEFSADGTVAYVVDVMFNSYHILNTRKGQDGDVTTLFASPSAFGPGGKELAKGCIPDALRSVTGEGPFRMAPQAQITPIDGYEPFDTSFVPVDTGVEFDAAAYYTNPLVEQMKRVPDAIGTAPIGVRLAPDGHTVYVANYLARNVVPVAAAEPLDGSGKPANLRCVTAPATTCATSNDCPAGAGFCNHPGGAACRVDGDCGPNGPCVRSTECVPIVLDQPASSITGGIAADPLPPALLDGKILFNTAARDSSVPNKIGLGSAAPIFNDAARTGRVPGSVVSVSHDASYVTCTGCHADFGGQDGRTWDFSQFGASLRNTMDLRGRPAFAPGHCSQGGAATCFYDAGCGPGNFCRMDPALIPPNIPAADRDRYFNPMLTIHWNGDRDEVEDFEHTYRQLMGAGDCDGLEDIQDTPPEATEQRGGCMGALVQRSRFTSTDPVDVHGDLGPPNRNLRGQVDPSKVVGIRLSHMADFVYSLTAFVPNPNPPDAAAERGRKLFNDPQTRCAECHSGGPATGEQFFSDKRPKRAGLEDFDPSLPAGPDRNNPFLRHDVGTANLFDLADPNDVASQTQSFQNSRASIPAHRGPLGDYVTPVIVDAWNTAPYLHDGSAPTLLDVIRPCDTSLDDCLEAGRGRNLDDKHGATSILTPQQLNELAAFQKTLTLATVVGNGDRVVSAGKLALTRAIVAFGVGGAGTFKLAGILSSAPGPVDPTAGLVLTLATPANGRMTMVSVPVPMEAAGRGFVGRTGEGGTVIVRLRNVGDGKLRFSASGRGVDLAPLATGNPDVTVALEVGGTNFVKNRKMTGSRNVMRLPRKGRP